MKNKETSKRKRFLIYGMKKDMETGTATENILQAVPT